jgi:hypothetical protein
MRRFVFVATLLLVAGVAFYFYVSLERKDQGGSQTVIVERPVGPDSRQPASSSRASSAAKTGATSAGKKDRVMAGAETAASSEADFPIAAALNAPNSTLARDLDIVRQIFEAWQSNFPREGNPVGENAEITSALMGENRLGLALIPKDHRAVNSRGELCDRWGTPFRFHQLSGSRMEIRSAGPDQKFLTDDDAVWTPP